MKRIEKYLLLLIVIAISLFTLLVITNKTRYLDYKIFVMIHNIIKYNDINMVKLISDLSVILGILLSSLMALYFSKKMFLKNILNIIFAYVLNFCIKICFCIPRPSWKLTSAVGYSYPSAHTMLALVVYGNIIYLTNTFIKQRVIRIIIYILSVFMIILTGLSRIYLGVHYASDVIGAYIIALIDLLGINYFYETSNNSRKIMKNNVK